MGAKRQYGSWFWCDTCDPEGKTEYDADGITAHLRDVHGITELRGKRQMVTHMDGAKTYSSIYILTIGDVVVRQETHTKRTKAEARMWS